MATVSLVTCDTESGLLVAGDPWKTTDLLITAAAACYVGPTGVTTATGFALATGRNYNVRLAPQEELYCVGAAGTEVISVLATNVY